MTALARRVRRLEDRIEPKGERVACLYYKPGKPMPGIAEGTRRVVWYPEKLPEGAAVGC